MDVQQIKQKTKKRFLAAQSLPLYLMGVLVVLSSLFFSPSSKASEIMIIADIALPVHKLIINNLTRTLTAESITLTVHHPDKVAKQSSISAQEELIITLGLAAAKSAAKLTSDTPILFALLPKVLAENFIECIAQSCPQKRAALFIEQPINRQLNLIKILFPNLKNLSFLYGDFSMSTAIELNALAKKMGYKTFSARIEESSQLSRKLDELLQQTELLVALPDPLIHNRHSIPQLLLSTYRYSIPIIGFSKSYVSAGAIAAVFSSTEELSAELTTLAKAFLKIGVFPIHGRYPTLYRVQINKDVARSMNLRFPSSVLLHKRLLEMENGS
jgi:ABC-type uncharacterized transport system substrate-binding protein